MMKVGHLTFDANFDSGNLVKAELDDGIVYLRLRADAHSQLSTWFHFSVSGAAAGEELRFVIEGYTNQSALFNADHRPVVRALPSRPAWQLLRAPCLLVPDSDGAGKCNLHMRHKVEQAGDTLFFAFTFPYPFNQLCRLLDSIEASHGNQCLVRVPTPAPPPQPTAVYFAREVLALSLEGRPVEMLTISSCEGVQWQAPRQPWPEDARLFPSREEAAAAEAADAAAAASPAATVPRTRPHVFKGKRVVMITARVHPGETPGSFALEGILEVLLRQDDPRSARLRQLFVFLVVPCLNPDGVVLGHFRFDTLGKNLNRSYADPDPRTESTIWATKYAAVHLVPQVVIPPATSKASDGAWKPLSAYLDCHAHAGKRGCFLFSNALLPPPCVAPASATAPNAQLAAQQVDLLVFPRLVSLHTCHLDVSACDSSVDNMGADGDGGGGGDEATPSPTPKASALTVPVYTEGQGKEGSARVALYRATGVLHAYTLECNFATGRTLGVVPPAVHDGGRASPPRNVRHDSGPPPRYTPPLWREVGRACMMALLDLCGANPWSRLPRSEWKSLDNLRKVVHRQWLATGDLCAPRRPAASTSASAATALPPVRVPTAAASTAAPRSAVVTPRFGITATARASGGADSTSAAASAGLRMLQSVRASSTPGQRTGTAPANGGAGVGVVTSGLSRVSLSFRVPPSAKK